MRTNAEDVVHQYPAILADALPHVRCLAGAALAVDLLGMIVVVGIDAVGNHVLDAAGILLCHIGHEVAAVGHRTDVGIEHLYLLIGIFEEQLRLC